MTRPLRAVLLVVGIASIASACAASPPTASPTAAMPSVAATSIGALPSFGPTGVTGARSGAPGEAPGADPGSSTEPPTSPGGALGIIEVSVLDAAGKPVANAQMAVASGGTAWCCAEAVAPGRFRVSLPAGIHELQVTAPGYLAATEPVTLEAGQRLLVDLVLVAGEPSPEPQVTLEIVPGAAAGDPSPVDQVVDGKLSGWLTVTGILIGRLGGEMQLCAAVLESYPPQCGRPRLVIVGLQVGLLKGLQQANGVVWLNEALTITGDVTRP